MRAVLLVEFDVRYCALRYGETTGAGTCPAVLGVDSAIKCFNTPKTCPVRASFIDEPMTLRFGLDNGFLPRAIECIPSLIGVSETPATVSLGRDLGQRGRVVATFADGRDSDTGTGFDKYAGERGHDPALLGTIWGKFRARHPFLQGRRMRVIRGFLPESFAGHYPMGVPLPAGVLIEQDVRHHIVENFDGPSPADAVFTITAQDVLKLADDDRSLAPKPSNGRITAGIGSGDMAFTLSPAGIGDLEYPASGHAAIGGAEIVSFTRAGDSVTIAARGQKGTAARAHEAGDRVQLVLSYSAATPAAIFDDLARIYAGIDPDFIPIESWENECATYLGRVYSADIAKPTPVRKLMAELIEQACLAVWWDSAAQLIRMRVLRPIGAGAQTFDDTNILTDDNGVTTLRSREQWEKRETQSFTYFGLRNPLEDGDDDKNYRASRGAIDTDAEIDYAVPVIKRIFSRWIPGDGGAAVADRINEIRLSRFRDPPRRFNFNLFRRGAVLPQLGGGYFLGGWPLQEATGERVPVPVQITRIRQGDDILEIEAEEVLGGAEPADLVNRTIIIDSNSFDLNVRTIHDTLYPPPTDDDVSGGVNLTIIVENGVFIGSTAPEIPAMTIGEWPEGFPVTLQLSNGNIIGRGGDGGAVRFASGGFSFGSGFPGEDGAPAIYTRHPLTIEGSGRIWGGGGGGGAGGSGSDTTNAGAGGGGSGFPPGKAGAGSYSRAANGEVAEDGTTLGTRKGLGRMQTLSVSKGGDGDGDVGGDPGGGNGGRPRYSSSLGSAGGGGGGGGGPGMGGGSGAGMTAGHSAGAGNDADGSAGGATGGAPGGHRGGRGGDGGPAIDGDSFATFDGEHEIDVRGDQIN